MYLQLSGPLKAFCNGGGKEMHPTSFESSLEGWGAAQW